MVCIFHIVSIIFVVVVDVVVAVVVDVVVVAAAAAVAAVVVVVMVVFLLLLPLLLWTVDHFYMNETNLASRTVTLSHREQLRGFIVWYRK